MAVSDVSESRDVIGAAAAAPDGDAPHDAVPYGAATDGDGAVPGDTALDRLCGLFRRRRRDLGPQVADAAWVDRPFDDWLDNLRRCGHALAAGNRDALAVGMTESLAIRDALIVSLVTGRAGRDKQVMMDFASRPHAPDVCGRMGRMLSQAFHDPRARPDARRCGAGIAMLRDMADGAPERFRVQPLAVVAYVLWWLGNGSAARQASAVLTLDAHCSLAGIVLGALHRGMAPAWLGDRPGPVPDAGSARDGGPGE